MSRRQTSSDLSNDDQTVPDHEVPTSPPQAFLRRFFNLGPSTNLERATHHAHRRLARREGRRTARFTIKQHLNLITHLTVTLIKVLFSGTLKWIFMLFRLGMFVFFLLPGFITFGLYYIRYPIKNVSYGPSSRNMMDVYPVRIPSGDSSSPRPVVVFLTGGAWIIGYKMWGALMGRALAPNGVLLVIPDYRNFPQTDVKGMMTDVDMAIGFIRKNIHEYGGDPDNIVLVGQSAGAHLGSLVLMLKSAALRRARESGTPNTFSFHTIQDGVDFDLAVEQDGTIDDELQAPLTPKQIRDDKFKSKNSGDWGDDEDEFSESGENWEPTDLKGFVCISGPYDLCAMVDHFATRGLDPKILNIIFQSSLSQYSPTIVAQNLASSNTNLSSIFPTTKVIHGSTDISVPLHIGSEFNAALKSLKIKSDFLVYEGWTHTDPILERPMAGNHLLHRDLYEFVKEQCDDKFELGDFDETNPLCRRIMWPQASIEVARFANPF